MKTKLQFTVFFLLVFSLFISGCGSGQLTAPTATFTPTIIPTPISSIRTPVTGNDWKVTINSAYQKNSLELIDPNLLDKTYTPKGADDTLLVVEVAVGLLPSWSDNERTFSSEEVGVLIEDDGGKIVKPVAFLIGNSQYTLLNDAYINSFVHKNQESENSFVFIINKESILKPLKFRFQDLPLILFYTKE